MPIDGVRRLEGRRVLVAVLPAGFDHDADVHGSVGLMLELQPCEHFLEFVSCEASCIPGDDPEPGVSRAASRVVHNLLPILIVLWCPCEKSAPAVHGGLRFAEASSV